MILESTDQ
jgi:superfamily II DNA helicase RecQ